MIALPAYATQVDFNLSDNAVDAIEFTNVNLAINWSLLSEVDRKIITDFIADNFADDPANVMTLAELTDPNVLLPNGQSFLSTYAGVLVETPIANPLPRSGITNFNDIYYDAGWKRVHDDSAV